MALGPKTENTVNKGSHNQLAGRDIHGMDPALFVKEMRRKDARIDGLIEKNEALQAIVSDLKKAELERELAELRDQKAGWEAKLATPQQAFGEHKERATQIEQLLDDVATQQALGENRTRSALEAFANLEYEEIDALLAETEENAILTAANAAYGRGLVAEDAIKWHDAAEHYAKAARLAPSCQNLSKASELSWRTGDYNSAIEFGEQAVIFGKTELGPGDESTLEAFNNLALSYRAVGKNEKANELYLEAMNSARKAFGRVSHPYGAFTSNRGWLLQTMRRFEEAEPMIVEAMEIARELYGEASEKYLNAKNNLAILFKNTDRFKQAEELYNQVLDAYRENFSNLDLNSDYAGSLNNLAELMRLTGRSIEAEPYARQAMKIRLNVYGPEHPQYAQSLNNLALTLGAAEKYTEVEGLLREAVRIYENRLGYNHRGTQGFRSNLERLLKAREGQ